MTFSLLQNVLSDENYVTVLSILLAVALVGIYKSNRTKNLPPGPWGLPFIGYIPFIKTSLHETLADLTKQFGPIFRIQLGSLHCIVLGNFEAIRDAFLKQNENFSGRPKGLLIRVFDNETAFILDEGPSFKDVRMFSVDALKKFGFGRLSMEPIVKLEIRDLLKEFAKTNGQPTNVHHKLLRSVGRAICCVLCGSQSEFSDSWIDEIIDSINGLEKTYNYNPAFFFPWLQKISLADKLTKKSEQKYWKSKLWELWRQKVEETRARCGDDSNLSNFITVWLDEEKSRKAKNDPTAHLYSEFNLINNLDVFTQGAFETTANTILWAFHILMSNPDIQKKFQQEIDKHFEEKGDLSLNDSKFMPYTKAFIQELHRFVATVPIGLFRCNLEATTLMGYQIPKRTIIISNLYGALHDDKEFADPFKFNPERFLTDSGEFIHSEKVIPFSVGKRFCPGSSVAQMEIFNYLTQTLRAFKLEAGPTFSAKVEATVNDSLIRRPNKFDVCFIPRNITH